MSTTDLKLILHERIDSLQKEEDLQDLLLTIDEFVSQRTDELQESPELINQLQRALDSVKDGRATPNSVVMNKAKGWLTR